MVGKHAVITDEMIARNRSRIGQEWVPQEPYFNTQATTDAIRHFCHGIGDTNPLYCDSEYARKTAYRKTTAPPCFLYSVYWPGGQGAMMPGIHGWHSGNDWEWYRPVLEGDAFTYTSTLVDFVEKPSRMAGRIFIGTEEVPFKDQSGQLVAKSRAWAVAAERGAAGEKGKYRHIKPATYTPDDIERIYRDYAKEVVRGATPRYWEDVSIGETLTPVVKGPLSNRDMNCWLMGAGSPYMKAHGIFVAYQKRHPAIGMTDSTTGQVDVPELVHMEPTRAQEIGVPGAYDYGAQRISWLGHLLTNWVGDDGFVWKLHAELRLFNVVGDTTWCKGKVTRKYVEKNDHMVDIECWGENQRDEVTMPGWATVILPSREKGTWPVRERLPR